MPEPRPNPDELRVRAATVHDVPAIATIYGHHVLTGIASFETEPPDAMEMRRRMVMLQEDGYPYAVAVRNDVVVGYSYAGPWRTRPAYGYSVESSVYLDHTMCGLGIGKVLLGSIIEQCTAAGFRQMVAVIGDSENRASTGLYTRLGFRLTGTLQSIGFKHGRWVDSVLMQRPLGDGDDTLPNAGTKQVDSSGI